MIFSLEIPINYIAKFTREESAKILDDKESSSSLVSIWKKIESNLDFGIFVRQRFDQVISNYLNKLFKIRLEVDLWLN